mgnify:CR=1 FL=1
MTKKQAVRYADSATLREVLYDVILSGDRGRERHARTLARVVRRFGGAPGARAISRGRRGRT